MLTFYVVGLAKASHRAHFLKKCIFIDFLESGRERETLLRENHPLAAPYMPPTRDRAHNPGRCPDGGSNCDLLVRGTTFHHLSHTGRATGHTVSEADTHSFVPQD